MCMKKMCVLLLISVFCSVTLSYGQTWSEWFKQKKTQKKYLLEQIAQLQVYISYMAKGYKIAREGLNTIQGIRKGEWNLHQVFFGSLKTVNPKIKQYAKIAAIVADQEYIVSQYKDAWKDIRNSGQFTSHELDYCYKVFSDLLDKSSLNITVLLDVLSNNELEMTDDERIKKIDQIYAESEEQRMFVISFSGSFRIEALNRINGSQDIKRLKILHDLK
jgi:hypothetical protein